MLAERVETREDVTTVEKMLAMHRLQLKRMKRRSQSQRDAKRPDRWNPRTIPSTFRRFDRDAA